MYQKIFGLVLAAFYNDDAIEFEHLKTWYGKMLALKKKSSDEDEVLMATLDDAMQQALKLIQHIHALEQDDDDEEDSEEE